MYVIVKYIIFKEPEKTKEDEECNYDFSIYEEGETKYSHNFRLEN